MEKKKPQFEVGDIFVASWGYGQTNVDAYQVVEKPSAHYAILKPIAMKPVEGSEGMDCCRVVPVKDSFCAKETHDSFWEDKDKPFRKKVSVYGHITLDTFASAYKWDGKATFYNSWYY